MGSVTLGGRSVVMDLPLGNERVPRSLSQMSSCGYLIILLCLLVHCLLVLFLFGFVLLVLLVEPRRGGCLCLVRLLVWLPLVLEWFRRLLLRVWIMGFTGLVVLDRDGKEFDQTEKPPAHLAGLVLQSRPRVWKRLNHVGPFCVSVLDRKRRRRDQDDVGNVPAQIRTGVG